MLDLRFQVVIYPEIEWSDWESRPPIAMKVIVDSTLTAYKVALWWTILCMNCHDTLTKTLIRNSLTDSDLFHSMNCQEYRPPSKTKDPTQGCLERMPYHIVFSGPRCLVFMQLDPDHPGSQPFWKKVYISVKRSAIVLHYQDHHLWGLAFPK